MKVCLQRILNPVELGEIKELYCNSFPPDERREFDGLKMQLLNPKCNIHQINTESKKGLGFCIYWVCADFIFLEHFAVMPDFRGQGIGEGVLTVLRKKFPIIILETELPENDINKRRILFYERNGFRLLNLQYFQPAYDNNKSEVELQLMCTELDFPAQTIENYIQQIRKIVYQNIS